MNPVTQRDNSPVAVLVPDIRVLGIDVARGGAEFRLKYKWSTRRLTPLQAWFVERGTAPPAFAYGCIGWPAKPLPESALHEFSSREVRFATFLQRYGELVRRRPAIEEMQSKRGEEPYASHISERECREEHRRLVNLLRMFSLLRTEDMASRCQASKIAHEAGFVCPNDPAQSLIFETSQRMYGQVSLALDMSGKVVFNCMDVLSGLYALLAKGMIDCTTWLFCPECGKRFQPKNTQQECCKPRCANARRQRRFRVTHKKSLGR